MLFNGVTCKKLLIRQQVDVATCSQIPTSCKYRNYNNKINN